MSAVNDPRMPQAEDDFGPGMLGSAPLPAEERSRPEPAPEPEPTQEREEQHDPVEVLAPVEVKTRYLGVEQRDKDDNVVRPRIELYQRELSFFGKLELIRFLSKSFNAMVKVEEGQLTLWEFLGAIGLNEGVPMSDVSRADVAVRGIARFSEVVPDFVEEFFCIVLNVRREQRETAKNLMRNPAEEGGFDDETGWDVVETALGQNVAAFMDFFVRARATFDRTRNTYIARQRSSMR